MGIIDIFSKRQARIRGEVPDVYTYGDLPEKLRVQIIYLWRQVLGNEQEAALCGGPKRVYTFIVETLCEEYGVFFLPGTQQDYGNRDLFSELATFLGTERNVERVLDAVELSFLAIDVRTRDRQYLSRLNADELADEAINTLNARFKEHGIGYQYSDGQIIRIDSELIHSEIIKPALRLLNDKHYAGAQEEFLKAHAHYRRGSTKEVLNECLKAFESVMKAICKKRGWVYPPNATANALTKLCLDNQLIPPYLETHYGALRTMLESGVPTIRNKEAAAHGQGEEVIHVPDHIAGYALHMTASAIVFLTECDRALS